MLWYLFLLILGVEESSRINPKSIKNQTKNWCCVQHRFRIDFWLISGASKPSKWCSRCSVVHFFIKSMFRKSHPKMIQKCSQNQFKINQKSITNLITKNKLIIGMIFDQFLIPEYLPGSSLELLGPSKTFPWTTLDFQAASWTLWRRSWDPPGPSQERLLCFNDLPRSFQQRLCPSPDSPRPSQEWLWRPLWSYFALQKCETCKLSLGVLYFVQSP